jgi:two-component system chemotaxis response regulator CheB
MSELRKKTRVLIVDDSAFARLTIARFLESDPELEVAGIARDGVDALEKITEVKPDVITLDVEMPRMDGLTALERIMAECPTPVVMLSALTAEGADVTIRALEIGAVDFFLKPSLINPVGDGDGSSELNNKIKSAVKIDVSRLTYKIKSILASSRTSPAARASQAIRNVKTNRLVIIGSSTGGPRALFEILPSIPGDLPAPVLIVQHMPPKFTRSMAERLNDISQLSVKEAEAGDRAVPGQALLAPGGFHMVVKKNGEIGLTQDKPRNGVRPAVDVTMESAVKVYGSRCVGVVLTGMGSDGTQGAAMIKAGGGSIIAEHESTAVIYGMPRSVVEAGLADKILPLNQVAGGIESYCNCTVDALMKV